MSEPLVTFGRAMGIAERAFEKWSSKPHNRKWVRRIDGTPIPNDLKVNIALAIMESLRDDLPDEKQRRIYRLERRIHYQRMQLRNTWEIVEKRAAHRRAWLQSPLLKSMLARGRKRTPFWQRFLNVS